MIVGKTHRFVGVVGFAFLISSGFGFSLDLPIAEQSAEEALSSSPSVPAQGGDVLPTEGYFEFTQDDWNRARKETEPPEPAPVLPARKSKPASGTEPAPGISVDLPYESGLVISGRKVIELKLDQTRRNSAERAEEMGLPQNQSDVEMRQELQVRIKGQVGPKIAVNVDFDDTKEDKRDISVVYTGDPDEFVQEAAFGDITLSLPSTEFVSYSKQLFGVRTRLKYRNAQLTAIGSRTKGTTETRRFNGATKFERRVIRDVDFVKKQFYDLAFTTRPIQAGSLTVWRDDGIATNNGVGLTTPFTGVDFAVAVATASGEFASLKPGDDFIMDYGRGVLQMKRSVGPEALLIVDYVFDDDKVTRLSQIGAAPGLKIIKTINDTPLSSDPLETGYQRELKTFYNLGNIKIVRDNGRGNFILRTVDSNQNDLLVQMSTAAGVGTPSGSILEYAETLDVDFDRGYFNIALTSAVADPQLYGASPVSKFSFLTEYRYRVRDYQLRPNVIFGSERVTLNGRLLRSDVDYFIAYDIGLLQFFNDDLLDETTQIEVTYDYAPFGGQLGQTLVGTRLELGLIPGRAQAGGTFLYTFAPKTTVVPDIRNTPSSLMVLEVDGRVTDMRLPFTAVKMTLSGEAAQSRENPNLYGKAIVDSMEGVSQEDPAALVAESWFLGANRASYGYSTRPSSLLQVNDESLDLDDVVGPSAGVNESEKLQVLRVDYALDRNPGGVGPEESSLITPLSKVGRDFSKKRYIEFWVEGSNAAGAGVRLDIDAGAFNEDADGDHTNLKPETEDLNNDGSLNEGEDVGWTYDYPGDSRTMGSGNGRIDSEDLDGNGKLRISDVTPRTVPLLSISTTPLPAGSVVTNQDGSDVPLAAMTDLNFSGWRFIRVPLSIAPTEEDSFKGIYQVRLTLRAPEAASSAATVRIGKIAFVGNTWETAAVTGGAQMDVGAVNNLDNPDYQTLVGNAAYNELYGEQAENKTREQALSLKFNLPALSTATTRSVYGAPRDFSTHQDLNFFYFAPDPLSPDVELFVQLGSETDYFEIPLPRNPTPDFWNLATLRLVDLNNDGTPDTLQLDGTGTEARVIGSPLLSRVGQFKIGVRHTNPAGLTAAGNLWINEIHVNGARNKIGDARRFALDGAWKDWGNFGGTFRSVDRNFQTLTSPVVNQDRQETTGFMNFNRWKTAPLSATYNKSLTVTPAAIKTGQSQLVSLLSEGRAETVRARADGSLLFTNWPEFAYSAERLLEELTDRQERRDRSIYSGSLNYSPLYKPDLLPGEKWSFTPVPTNIFVKYIRSNYALSYFPEREEEQLALSTDTVSQQNAVFGNARTLEYADDWNARMGFTLWKGFVLTPTYTQRKVVEQREFSEEDLALAPQFSAAQSYDKSFSQSHGLSLNWKILKWLEPRLTYSLSGTETNGLPTSSSPTAAGFKTIDRTATGDAFLNLRMNELFPKVRAVRTLTFDASFKIDSSDGHDNVAQDFTAWRRIEPFRMETIKRAGGSDMLSLLPALEFDGESALRRQMTARNTLRVAANWSPWDSQSVLPAVLSPLKTLTLSNTFTQTNEHTENTQTVRDLQTLSWFDLIATIRDLEKPFALQRWMSGTQWTTRLNNRVTEVFFEELTESESSGLDLRFTLFKKYDCSLLSNWTDGSIRDLKTNLLKEQTQGNQYSAQVGTRFGSWRLTPRVAYSKDEKIDGTGRALQDLEKMGADIAGRFDKAYPGGFRLPFMKKAFSNVNRLTLDAKLAYERRSSVLNFERDNTDTYGGEAIGEWEIARNFRLSFGGKASLVKNRAKPEDGLTTVGITSKLVIQF